MRLFCFLLLSLSFSYAQESEYKSSVIILKDGRMVSIRGDYEIIGDEVQFMYANGDLSALPLAKVDLEATEKRKAAIEKKILENETKAKAPKKTVYDEIRDFQKDQEGKPSKDSPAGDGNASAEEPKKRVFEKKVTQKRTFNFDANPLQNLEQEDVERKAEEIMDTFEQSNGLTKGVLLTLLILLIVSGLASLIIRAYLIWTSRETSGFWAVALLLTTTAPFIYRTFGSAIPDESVLKVFLGIGLTVLQLLEPIIYAIYIIVYCAGRRLLYLFLYFSPLLVIIGMVIAVIALGFPVPF